MLESVREEGQDKAEWNMRMAYGLSLIHISEEMIRESMAPVRQVAIGPMLVGRELEEINWEPVKLEDPRLRSEWLEDFRQFALTDRDSLTLAGRARFERDSDSWQVSLYHEVDYLDFQNRLQKQGFSLPTADEWAYLCGDVYKRQDTDCNLPIFASGWGDGYYPVYFGYDAKGEVCAVYVRFIDIEASYQEQN